MREEGAHEQNVDWQARAARHEGVDQDGDQAAAVALDGAGGHHRRHVAPKTGEHREERFAMQTDPLQQRVEQERGTCQVATVL